MSRSSEISASKRLRSSGRTRTRCAEAATSRCMTGEASKSGGDHVGQGVDGLPVSEPFDVSRVVRPGVPHHEHRGRVETLDQQPHLLVDRQVERSAHAPHALIAEPAFGGPEQRREGLCAVLGVQHPEEAGCVGVALEMQRVDLRADPPDRSAAAPGDPRLPPGVLEVRIAAGRQMEAALDDERLDPGRVGCEDPAGHLDEAIQAGPAFDGNDAQAVPARGWGAWEPSNRAGRPTRAPDWPPWARRMPGAHRGTGRPERRHTGAVASLSYKRPRDAVPTEALT